MERWRAYFKAEDGRVLRTPESWSTPEEAAMRGQAYLRADPRLRVEDPHDRPLGVSVIDPDAGMTVEMSD